MIPAPFQEYLRPPGRWESAFITVALLLVTGAFCPIFMTGSSDFDALGDSNPATMLSALVIYMIALLLLMRRPGEMMETIKSNHLLLVVFAFPVVSILWSVDHGTTFRRSVALVMTGIFCVYIAQRLSPEEFLRRLLIVLFIGGVLSFLYTGIAPARAIVHGTVNNGSWNGVYGQKAILGRIAAIAVTVSVYVRPRHFWERPMRWITIAMFLFLSIKSQSRASWLMMIGGVGFMMIIAIMRSRRLSNGVKMTIALGVSLTVLITAAALFNTIITAMGRDDTFSGRTTLWHGAIQVAMASHPVLGAGYRAFWTATGAAGVREYIMDWARMPSHGHNGYLDLWLELGYAGVALFAVFVIVTVTRITRRILAEPDEPAWAAFAIFFFVFLLNNCSVSVAYKHTDIAWVFAVLASLYTRGCVTARLPVMPRLLTQQALRIRARAMATAVRPVRAFRAARGRLGVMEAG